MICWRNVSAQRANALPQHSLAVVPEGHAEVVEIPKDWPQRAEEGDVEHHVVVVEGDSVTVDLELFVADQDADVMSKALTDDAVTVGHHDLCTAPRLEVKTSKPRGGVGFGNFR